MRCESLLGHLASCGEIHNEPAACGESKVAPGTQILSCTLPLLLDTIAPLG